MRSRIRFVLPRLLLCVAAVTCVLGLGEVSATAGPAPSASAPTAAHAGVPQVEPDDATASGEGVSGGYVAHSPHHALSAVDLTTPSASAGLAPASSGPGEHPGHGGHGLGAALSAASCMTAVTGVAMMASPGLLSQDPVALVATRLPARASPAAAALSPASVDPFLLCVQRV